MESIVEDVNRTSESQTGSLDGPEESKELGNQPKTGDGAEEQVSSQLMKKKPLMLSKF